MRRNLDTNSQVPLQNVVQKVPDCGTGTRIDREWRLLLPMGLWLVAVVCLDGCSCFLEASGRLLLGPMEMRMPRALEMTPGKMASALQMPRHNLAHFRRAKLCHSKFSPVPNFPLPRYALSTPSRQAAVRATPRRNGHGRGVCVGARRNGWSRVQPATCPGCLPAAACVPPASGRTPGHHRPWRRGTCAV